MVKGGVTHLHTGWPRLSRVASWVRHLTQGRVSGLAGESAEAMARPGVVWFWSEKKKGKRGERINEGDHSRVLISSFGGSVDFCNVG